MRFVQDDAPVAVGFGMSVDGLRFTFQLPTAQALTQATLPPALQAACQTAYYRWLVLSDPQLPSTVTVFEREWLHRVFLATAVQALLTHNSPSLLDAARALTDADFQAAFDALFTHQDVVALPLASEQDADSDEALSDDDETTTAAGAGDNRQQRHGRLTQQLQELLAEPAICARLYAALAATGNLTAATWGLWLRRRLHETLTQACLLACQQVVATRAGTDTLLADPLPIAAEGPAVSWINAALAICDVATARTILAQLEHERRLDALNLNFLEIATRSAVGDWSGLLALECLPHVLAARRPPAVSAAIAEAVWRWYLAPALESGGVTAAIAVYRTETRQFVAVLGNLPRNAPRCVFAVMAVAVLAGDLAYAALTERLGEAGIDELPPALAQALRERRPLSTTPVAAVVTDPLATARAALLQAAQEDSLEICLAAQATVDSLNPSEQQTLLAQPTYRALWRFIIAQTGAAMLPDR